MGIAAICNTYTDLLNSWTESDKQANVRHQACLDGAKVSENGYRILCLGGGNGIPENTCEAKVRHYASKLAEHIYQETKLPPVKDPVVLGEYSPILSRCHSLYEYGKGAERTIGENGQMIFKRKKPNFLKQAHTNKSN